MDDVKDSVAQQLVDIPFMRVKTFVILMIEDQKRGGNGFMQR